MNIPGQGPIQFLESYLLKIKETDKAVPPKDFGRKESAPSNLVGISEKAKHYNQVYQLIASTPDIRSERVEEVQRKLETGTYSVQEEQIAEKMVWASVIDSIL